MCRNFKLSGTALPSPNPLLGVDSGVDFKVVECL